MEEGVRGSKVLLVLLEIRVLLVPLELPTPPVQLKLSVMLVPLELPMLLFSI